MKHLYLALCVSLVLSACGVAGSVATTRAVLSDVASVTPPSTFADKTVLDEQAAMSIELAYKAVRLSMETAVDAGLLKGPAASKAAEIDGRAFSAVTVVRQAYAAGNANSYRAALVSARKVLVEFIDAIGST